MFFLRSSLRLVDPPATMDLQEKQACWKLELEVSKFDPSKKKKKKTNKTKLLIREDEFQKGGHFAEGNSPHCQPIEPDYGYKELLSRVLVRLRDDDIEVSTGKPRTVMRLPQLLAEGTRITVCLNFADLCRTMHRKTDHVMKFLLGQMETKGLLNKLQQLEMKGLVSSKDFQAVFRRYIDAFVICSCCRSPDTVLVEDKGVGTLKCEMCGLVASVNPL